MWGLRKSSLNYHASEHMLDAQACAVFGTAPPDLTCKLAQAFHKAAVEIRGELPGRRLFANQLHYGSNWVPQSHVNAARLSNRMVDRTLKYLHDRATSDAVQAKECGAADVHQALGRIAFIANTARETLSGSTQRSYTVVSYG